MTLITAGRFVLFISILTLCSLGWVLAVPDVSLVVDFFGGVVIGISVSLYGKLSSLRNIHTNNLIIRGYQDRAVVDQARYVRLREQHEELLQMYRDLGGEETN